MPKAQHLQQGEDAERACCRFLKQQGLKLVCSNYRCRYGEIDLIMLDGDTLVFTEVRFRSNKGFGDGLDSITHAKQEKLRRTAEHYLQRHGYRIARFDVVSVSKKNQTGRQQAGFLRGLLGDASYDFKWVANAF